MDNEYTFEGVIQTILNDYPEIIIPELATLVLPTNVYTSCHYIKEIITAIAFDDIAFFFDFYHPSVVVPE
ncbi:MAG: hypothetical protein GX625_08075 [Clostridiaceae bacterium]|jgi:hypothetical protein|nr:hypothetical protein [Candidatus Izemoplasmatales bacterium]NLE25285.1 hypothetical protein [Clostridiaceae bacterium]